jgi:hypothetical protein
MFLIRHYFVRVRIEHPQANSKKNLDFCYLPMKTDVNVPSKSNRQNNFLLTSCQPLTKKAGSGSISQWYGSADPDPDPSENVTDPQHCF